jgi:hypothetical protein
VFVRELVFIVIKIKEKKVAGGGLNGVVLFQVRIGRYYSEN